MSPLKPLANLYARLRAKWMLHVGVRHYRTGRLDLAAERIESSVALAGSTFDAHVYLGRIFLRLGEFERARGEFAQARLIDPRRFVTDGLPEDLLLEVAERLYQPSHGSGSFSPQFLCEETPVDDFSSTAERERFRHLPAIEPSDIDEIDWDGLSERLLR